jgi:uncharacterized protein (DUF697 family)
MAEKKNANVQEKEILEKKPGETPTGGAAEDKTAVAHKLTNRYMLWSMGAGLIPVPWLDLGALAGVQLKMVHRLSGHYEVPFSQNLVKSIIAALVGTISADYLRRSAFTSFIKSIPIIGFIGSVSMPIYSGAITYAVGKVFIKHFESGGTLLSFDPKKVKDHFAKLVEEGKLAASKLKTKIA